MLFYLGAWQLNQCFHWARYEGRMGATNEPRVQSIHVCAILKRMEEFVNSEGVVPALISPIYLATRLCWLPVLMLMDWLKRCLAFLSVLPPSATCAASKRSPYYRHPPCIVKVSSNSGVLRTNSQSNVQLHDKKNAQKLDLSYFDQRLSPVYLDSISNTKEAMGGDRGY